MVMSRGAGRPNARFLMDASWKNDSSLPDTNHSRSMPFSCMEATNASEARSAGISCQRLPLLDGFDWMGCSAIMGAPLSGAELAAVYHPARSADAVTLVESGHGRICLGSTATECPTQRAVSGGRRARVLSPGRQTLLG